MRDQATVLLGEQGYEALFENGLTPSEVGHHPAANDVAGIA
jgi:hypothetical protein